MRGHARLARLVKALRAVRRPSRHTGLVGPSEAIDGRPPTDCPVARLEPTSGGAGQRCELPATAGSFTKNSRVHHSRTIQSPLQFRHRGRALGRRKAIYAPLRYQPMSDERLQRERR